MTKLTIMSGVPGSGKSTLARQLAKETDTVIVSRDDLRFAFYGKYFGEPIDENFITSVEHAAIRKALLAGKNVISDNTHVRASYINDKIKVAWEVGAEYEVFRVDTPLAVSLVQNRNRDRVVPDNVILKMHKQFMGIKDSDIVKMPEFETYVPDTELPRCMLFDIDGTLATKSDKRGYFDWDKVGLDPSVSHVADIAFYLREGFQVDSWKIPELIIFSGRDGSCYNETHRWLIDNGIPFDRLFMRAPGDMRPDTIVKMEMFDREIRDNYNCLGVFDDRPSVVRTWTKYGIPVFHVAPYAEDF